MPETEMHAMEFRQLITFCEIMVTGSVSKAANNLGRTQPSVSHVLARLEDELGMPLFERRGGRLFPVPEAEFLYRRCTGILREVDETKSTMQSMRNVEEGDLRIVSMPGPTIEFLPDLIARHLGTKRKVRTTLLTRSSENVHRLMDAQQFDIGIADEVLRLNDSKEVSIRRTFRYRRVCAVAANHPLAKRNEVSIHDLAGEPLASLFPEHGTTRDLVELFREHGLEPDIRFVGQFFLPLLTYVQRAQACAIVDPIAMVSWKRSQLRQEDVVFLPFEPELAFGVDIITPKVRARSKVAMLFETRLLEILEELEQEQACQVHK